MRRNLTNRLATLAVLLPALALGAPACSDDDSGVCDNVADPCDVLDTTSCLDNVVQTCSENADGCLEWTDTEVCGNNATCDTGMCYCNDPCTQDDTRCDGDVLEICVEDAAGCLYWAFDTDCAGAGESCDDTGADAVCVATAGCGNNTMEGTELCDGDDLGGQTCQDEGFGGGTLACNSTCDDYDVTGCTAAQTCGNDTTEGTEVCDGADVNNEDCIDHGFYGGTLGCATDCSGYDTSLCTEFCGDDTINGTEVCDGSDLASETCIGQGFYGGNLACATDCSGYDTTGCAGECGDGGINGTEVCDTNDFGALTCVDYGYYTGTLTCDASCANISDSGCSETCGDSTINGPEVCDDVDLGTATCLTEGFAGGTLGCLADCSGFDTSGCTEPGGVCTNPYDLTGATFPVTLTGVFDDDPAGTISCESNAANAVWYEFTPTVTGVYTIDATNNTTTWAYGRVAVFDGTACNPYDTELVCAAPSDANVNTSVVLTAGSTYLIAYTTDGDSFTMVDPEISITHTPPGPGETCTTPEDLTGAVTFPYALTGDYTGDPADGFSCDSSPTNVVWYHYSPATSGWYDITATNNTTDWAYSRLVVLDNTFCSPYGAELACETNSSLSASAQVYLTGGYNYLIAFFTDGDTYSMTDPVLDIAPTPTVTVDWCNVQFPTSATEEEGQYLTIYGQLYIAGVTDQSAGIDFYPTIVAEVGVAPDGSDPTADPSLFTWQNAVPNVGDGNNDEYMADIVVPLSAGGPYDYAFRFSGDGGATWTYCDLDTSANFPTYDVAEAGELISTATTVSTTPAAYGDVIFTEVMQNPAALPDADGEWFELYNTTGADLNLLGCTIHDADSDNHDVTASFIVPAGAHATAANSATPGFTPSYVLTGTFYLSNGADELYLTCGGTLIDNIDWDGGPVWPDPSGNSMSLDPAAYDETFNDDGANWCEGMDYYNGDYGTPNAMNPSCN